MRNFLSAALCGLMLHAPAAAQDGGSVASVPAVSENTAAVAEVTEPNAATGDAVSADGKPEFALTPDAMSGSSATVGPVYGYTYFHRSGATLADQRADIDACRPVILAMNYTLAASAVQSSSGAPATPVYVPSTPGISPGAAAGAGVVLLLGAAAIAAAEQRAAELRSMQLNYENCMLVRGWSVMVLDNETGNALGRLSHSRLTERLEVMVGAAAPVGAMGRQFDNAHHFRALDDIDEMSLSLQFLPDNYFTRPARRGNNMLNATSRREERERALRARETAQREAERERAVQAAYEGSFDGGAVSVDIGTLAAELPEGSALILLGSAGPEPRFVRMNAQAGDGSDHIALAQTDTLSAFVVPAGEWRLVSLWTRAPATSHCLGAPVLRVTAGDVVFAGAFSVDGAADLTLDSARAALATQPHLVERLQAGSYTNGSTFECGAAWFATAYEIHGASFVEGYAGGSRAEASAAAGP